MSRVRAISAGFRKGRQDELITTSTGLSAEYLDDMIFNWNAGKRNNRLYNGYKVLWPSKKPYERERP